MTSSHGKTYQQKKARCNAAKNKLIFFERRPRIIHLKKSQVINDDPAVPLLTAGLRGLERIRDILLGVSLGLIVSLLLMELK